MHALAFPVIDPVAVALGPLEIRWYALAYVAGILLGWRYMIVLARDPAVGIDRRHIDDFVLWATLGVVLGGRLGYVLFYRPGHYLAHPAEILAMWQGGMSFHGGLCGVVLAAFAFAAARGIPWAALGDLACAAAPIGLFLGRLANFVNGELFGRPTDLPWGMAFPGGGPAPRHPSQLYEAALEGLALFLLLAWLIRRARALERPGLVTGAFLAGYAAARAAVELVREPDAHLGALAFGATMGQLLSLPVFAAGLWLMVRARRR